MTVDLMSNSPSLYKEMQGNWKENLSVYQKSLMSYFPGIPSIWDGLTVFLTWLTTVDCL